MLRPRSRPSRSASFWAWGQSISAPRPAEETEHLPAGQVLVQAILAGQVADAAPHPQAVGTAVQTQHPGVAAAGAQQIQQQPDRGGLARPVGPEKPEDLALGHLQIDPLDPLLGTIELGQIRGLDGRNIHLGSSLSRENAPRPYPADN